MSPAFPLTRFRRLRASQALRDLVQETTVTLNDLIYPIFVEEELDDFAPVESMPGIFRIPERKLAAAVKEIAAAGIRAVMLFGVSHRKDADGSDSWNPDGLMARMIRRAKDAAPGLVVISDTCFCEYTTHGHCGVIAHGDVHNDHTIENLGRQAVVAAKAGVDMIAPSSMMDGQVTAIRRALDGNGFETTPIMAYSSKFASAFYGPFRAAAGCDLDGDRKAYQMNPFNGREALREFDRGRGRGCRHPDGEARHAVSGRAGQDAPADAAADRRVSGQRRIRDDQVRRPGWRDRRGAGGARIARRVQTCRCRSDPELFRHGHRPPGVLSSWKYPWELPAGPSHGTVP